METTTPKTIKEIPVSVVTYRVKYPDSKEVNRILGRDLVEAERLKLKR